MSHDQQIRGQIMDLEAKLALRETEDTSGFYSVNAVSGELQYAPNRVDAPGGVSLRRDGNRVPAGGWQFFGSDTAAKAALGKTDADVDKALEAHGLRRAEVAALALNETERS